MTSKSLTTFIDNIEKSCGTYLEYVGILGSKLVYLKVLLFPILFTADNCLLEEKWVLKTKIGTIHKMSGNGQGQMIKSMKMRLTADQTRGEFLEK